MKFWRLIWNIIKAWWSYREEQQAEATVALQEAVQHQQEIIQEADNEIAQVEIKTDSELIDTAVDLGLVRRSDDGEIPGS